MARRKTLYTRIEEMTVEELRTEVASLRRSVAWLRQQADDPAVSAVDRTGKPYTRAEMVVVFERLYNDNPRAIALMFPSLTWDGIRSRAKSYRVTPHLEAYSEAQDDFIRRHYPDYKRILKEYPNRTLSGVRARAIRLKLTRGPRYWTAEEDAFLYRGQRPPDRTVTSCAQRRAQLGIRSSVITAVLKLSGEELAALVQAAVPRGYRDQVRSDAAQIVTELCLRGRCHPTPDELTQAARKAITEVYRLHPDRGAPISMDAKLFDDGDATVGDRIRSDAFHF